jgi:hypothetical protein
VRNGKTNEQPVLQGFADARNAGMSVDYVDVLRRSGTKYVLLTDRADEKELPGLVQPTFEWVKDCDFRVQSLADWDRPGILSLWRRRGDGGM